MSKLLQPKQADRDIEHEQISASTDEQLAARRAEIEAIGKRNARNGVSLYPHDLRSELQGIKSEQYVRENGLNSEPHVRYTGLPRRAADAPEQPANPTERVLDFAAQHHTQVQRSDKEVPESFGDLRPVEGQIDPSDFLVPDGLSGSRSNQDAVNIGNNRVFLKRYSDREGVFPLKGDHGSFGIAIRISAIDSEMLDELKGMAENHPSLDDEETAKADHEQIDEAWTDWAHFDFIRALESHLPGEEARIDALDDDQSRELFDLVRRRLGTEWTQDSGGVFIDVVPISETVTPEDLDATAPKVVKEEPAPKEASGEDYEAELAASRAQAEKARADAQKNGPSRLGYRS